MQIDKLEARRYLLAHQGLLPPHSLRGKDGVLDHIRKVNCIQFDPLDMVGHNSDLVLQARVKDYRREMLKELLYEDRKLLDGWDKMMSIYPVEDWPYFRRWREAHANHKGRNWQVIQGILPKVREAIQERGPLSAHDLQVGVVEEWDWGWPASLARAALESMYFWGELVIHHRVHTRKYYDFAHRLIDPALLDAPDVNLTEEAYQDWYIRRRIESVGLLWNRAGEAWLGEASIKSPQRSRAIQRLLEYGELLQVQVEDIREPFFMLARDRAGFQEAQARQVGKQRAAVIAPLDNLMWDRRMLKELFGFDYRWEVYVPAEKRRYGYYVLPVLYGDRFIARFDPARDRKRGVLSIQNWWWEAGVEPSDEMRAALLECMAGFLQYSGVERVELAAEATQQGGLEWMETLTV